MHADRFLKIPEVAETLRMSNDSVRRLIGRGELRCFRVGGGRGAIRVSSASLREDIRGWARRGSR